MRHLFALLLAALLFAPAVASAQPDTLLPATPYSTAVIVRETAVPGPAVIVLGGVHGDEPAGSLAAAEIAAAAVRRGTLIVIPRVNTLALDQGVRTLDTIGDINRAYPGKAGGTPAEQIAAAICALLERYQVSMLIDLHEGRAFHRLDQTSVGQTILFAANSRSALLAMEAAETINRQIGERHRQFSPAAHPLPHSAAHYAAERYGIAAFTLETAVVQPLADRIAQHVALVSCLLRQEGLL